MKGGVVILQPVSLIRSRSIDLPQVQKGESCFSCPNIDYVTGKFIVMTHEAIKTKWTNYTSLESQRMTLCIKYTFIKIYIMRIFEKSSVD